jgi:HK97 gp10 family phage protein
MAFTITVQGDKELLTKLSKLNGAVRGRISRASASTAMIPVRKRAKQLLLAQKAIESRTLLRSIGKKVKTKRGTTNALVGPRVGDAWTGVWKGKVRKPWKYAHFIEFGTKNAKAKPFAIPALTHEKNNVIFILESELGSRIENEARRL